MNTCFNRRNRMKELLKTMFFVARVLDTLIAVIAMFFLVMIIDTIIVIMAITIAYTTTGVNCRAFSEMTGKEVRRDLFSDCYVKTNSGCKLLWDLSNKEKYE